MPNTDSLDIKVVYDASAPRGRRRKSIPLRPTVAGRNRAFLVVGLLNLVAAGGMYYGTWWRVDPLIYLKFIMKTPIVGVDLQAASQIFLPAGQSNAPPPVEGEPTTTSKYTGRTAQVIIATTAYSWLTLATIASIALALSAGTLIGPPGPTPATRIGLILTLLGMAGLGFGVYRVWSEFGVQYRPDHFRVAMGAVTFLGITIGMWIGREGRRLTRLAACAMILSAVGTVVGLHLAVQCGVFEPEHATPTHLVAIFVAQSAWGWILWPATSRLRR